MTRKIFAVSLLVAMAAVFALAQGQATQPVKLTGYLVDNMCAGTETEVDEGMIETAKGHPTACSLMPGCSATGFSLVVDKKSYKLDEAGNKSALAVLKATKATKGLRVEIEGTVDGSTLRATKVSEVKAGK